MLRFSLLYVPSIMSPTSALVTRFPNINKNQVKPTLIKI